MWKDIELENNLLIDKTVSGDSIIYQTYKKTIKSNIKKSLINTFNDSLFIDLEYKEF